MARSGNRRQRRPATLRPGARNSGERASLADVTAEPPASRRAEAELLRLAREINTIARGGSSLTSRIRAALEHLSRAYAADASLPRALFEAWLARDGDGSAALAVGWAREQLRLAIADLLQVDKPEAGDLSIEKLAWVLLAACEAMAHDPPGGAAERVETLIALAKRVVVRL